MSDTKALETARKNLIALGKQYKSSQHVLIGQALDDIFQTENELAQLRTENAEMRALLAEIRPIFNTFGYAQEYIDKIDAVLAKYPEEPK